MISNIRHKWWLCLSCAIAFKALLLFVVIPTFVRLYPQAYQSGLFPDLYDKIAWNVASQNGYRVYADTSLTMLRTPGFVLLLAAAFSLFGKSLLAVQVINLVFSIVTAGLIFVFARRMFMNSLVACIAAALFFFHPGTLVADSRGGLESTLMLFIALFLWSAERAMRTKRYLDFAWLGLFFGLGMLVKSSVALILPGLAFWSFWTYRSDDFIFKLVKGYALAVLIAGLCMVPWVARNYAVSGQFVPTMTVGGLALFQGSHVVKSLGSGKNHADVLEDAAREQTKIARELKLRVHDGFFPQFYNTTDELIYYSELGRRAWSEYMNSPLLMASAITYNCWAFWFQGRSSTSTWFNLTLTLPLLVLVALGINLARRNRVDITIPVVVAACFIAPHLLILSMARYHVPLLPVLCLFAAYPIAGFSSRLLSSRCSMPMTLSSAGFKSRRSHGNDAG